MSSVAHAYRPGERVRAIIGKPDGRMRSESITLEDGSIVISKDDLAVFGDGDHHRGAREIRLMIAAEKDRQINERPCSRSESSSVRIARPEDEDAIFELLLLDVAENAEAVAPASHECIRETVRAVLNLVWDPGAMAWVRNPKAANVCGVIDGPKGKPIAVIMLMWQRWWWSKHFYYQEMPLFVHPDHRKGPHARSLIAFQKWWVDECSRAWGQRVHLLCGVLGTKQVRAKMMLYRRMFRQVGAAFLYPWPFGAKEN